MDLAALHVQVAPAWLAQCLAHLEAATPGFRAQSEQARLTQVLQQLLYSDLNQCGAPHLPANVAVRSRHRLLPLKSPAPGP